MLYVTTRNNQEAYTAHKAITENRAPDGGLYVPYRLPEYSREQIQALKEKSFGQCVSEILNLFFGTRLTAWDVDCTIGRSPVRVYALTQRILMGEAWHNLDWEFRRTAAGLLELITGEKDSALSDWSRTGIQIAVLFGFFGKLMRKNLVSVEAPMDVAVLSGDFSWPMAAWYARSMGLPIGNIILCCNDNNNPWELLHHGAMRTGAVAVRTSTPEGDYTVPVDLERFVSACGGAGEAARFVEDCRLGRMYVPADPVLEAMRRGIHASVVGETRVASAIPNVYSSHGQILEPYTALVYSGLMDYRAKTGEGRYALLVSDRGPGSCPEQTAAAMGISVETLLERLKIS